MEQMYPCASLSPDSSMGWTTQLKERVFVTEHKRDEPEESGNRKVHPKQRLLSSAKEKDGQPKPTHRPGSRMGRSKQSDCRSESKRQEEQRSDAKVRRG